MGASAISGVIITEEDSGTIIERGVFPGMEIKLTIANNRTIDGDGAF